MSLQLVFQNFRMSNFYLVFVEKLSFFAYSEILKKRTNGSYEYIETSTLLSVKVTP